MIWIFRLYTEVNKLASVCQGEEILEIKLWNVASFINITFSYKIDL